MTNSSQVKNINTPNTTTDYQPLSYLDTDMLFLRDDVYVAPQVHDKMTNIWQEGVDTGVFDNMFVGYPNRNAAFDGFAKKFNNFISKNTNWQVMRAGVDKGARKNGLDNIFDILKWDGNVSGRLKRDQENNTSKYAYSDVSRQGEHDREITYTYTLDTDTAVQKLREFTKNGGDVDFGNGKTEKQKLAINHQNASKWIAWQVRKYLEQQKNDLQNRYFSKDWQKGNFQFTEFDDVHRPQDNYGVMFFVEGTKYIEGSIPDFATPVIGNITIGEYIIGSTDSNLTIDQLDPENTSVWFSQFDVVEISTHTYNGEDLLDITIVIPEGIALNNKAKVLQVNTYGQKNGALVHLPIEHDDYLKESDFETYQVDGLIQKGLPKNFIVRFEFESPQPYWKMAINRTLSIIGNDTWADDGMAIGTTETSIKVDTNGKYQPIHPFFNGTKDEGKQTENRLIPADFISRKYETMDIGSLNRIKYRINGGTDVHFDRYASSLDLTKQYPLATILGISSDYWLYSAPHLFKTKNLELIGNNHFYSVTMRPVKPIYTHPITGYFAENSTHYVGLKTLQEPQVKVLNWTTINPDYTIFTNDGKYIDVRYTNSGQRSILVKNGSGYFDYDDGSFSSGTLHVTKDMPKAWLTTSNFDLNQTRLNFDTDTQYKTIGNAPLRPGNHDIDYQDWPYNRGWDTQEIEPAQILEYSVNGGAYIRVRPFNSPATLSNHVELKAGDTVRIRWTNIGDYNDKLPTSVRLIYKDPATTLTYKNKIEDNGLINAQWDFPLFGNYAYETPDGTGDVDNNALFLGNAIPTIDGHKRLYAGQNPDGSMNKVEVDTNKLDLSTIPVDLGVVVRPMRYI